MTENYSINRYFVTKGTDVSQDWQHSALKYGLWPKRNGFQSKIYYNNGGLLENSSAVSCSINGCNYVQKMKHENDHLTHFHLEVL